MFRINGRFLYIVICILLFGVFITFVNIFELRRLQTEHMEMHSPSVEGSGGFLSGRTKPIFWVYGKNIDAGHLSHVYRVLRAVGFHRATERADWELLWAHDYPFKPELFTNLQPHQKVNHFPGSGFITNKMNLATSNLMHVPRAFQIPADKEKFQQYAKSHPDTLWVQKSNTHRGIRIKSLDELDLDKESTFVQQYIDKPFLVDGRRFDIGVYATLTSVNPLRVYTHQGDWIVRFCPERYEPFDPNNVDKYVIGDDYTPVWNMPSLKNLYETQGYSFKDTLLAHIADRGMDAAKLDQDMRDTIADVYLKKEHSILKTLTRYKSSRNFFEMVRFDFVFDADLNVYLMEVNMSPNLSTGHFSGNKHIYQSVLYSLFNLVGVARPTRPEFTQGTMDEQNMRVRDRDITVTGSLCGSDRCKDNCLFQECRLCPLCLTAQQKLTLKDAYLEHQNRQTWRRVFPVPFKSQDDARRLVRTEESFRNLTKSNKWITMWFRAKCLHDVTWCQ